ncbi:MAG: lysylphosphatidylglycerol synthase transmembrane domain-containing protein [bacterium]|nr:lysylphosphatidylglycerol synthase transmembrane domain-containing protein [bacterium]
MKSNKWNLVFITCASLLVVGIIVLTNDVKQLFQIILGTEKLWLMLAILCMIGYCLLESGVLYFTANCIKRKLSFVNAFRTTMVGQLFNNITPFASGGQPMQLYYLTKSSFQLGEASSILLMKFIVYQSALIVYSTVLIFIRYSFFSKQVSKLGYFIGAGFTVNLLVVIGLFLIGFLPGSATKLTKAIVALLAKIRIIKDKEKTTAHAISNIEGFHNGFRQLMLQKSVLFKSIIITIAQLTCIFIIPFCICMALGIEVSSIISVVAASSFVMMISAFIPLPGASGGAEGSFYLLFGIFIIKPGLTAVALLLWRFITYYLPIIVGIFFCRLRKTNAA